jgi:hypothetical protein
MRAAGTRILALAFLSAVAGTGLAGCGSIDEALFGGGTEEAAQPPANAAPEAQAAPAPGTPVPPPAPVETGEAAAAPVVTGAAPPAPVGPSVSPVAIEGGANTGTAVGNTIQSLRSQLQNLDTKIAGDAQHAAELRNQDAQAVASYQQATAHISGRLGVGTTRGNPELIGEWNAAQATLDSLSANINALSALATEVSNDSSAAHNEGDTIQATFNVSGAVDEDHRQLSVLADETSQAIIHVDRLMSEVRRALQRQTAYVADERGNLSRLANAIKAGDYSSPMLGSARSGAPAREAAAASMPTADAMAAGAPIVTIKFARAHVSYDRVLYAALSQALASQPHASFNVVGVAPTRGDTAAVQLAQNSAQRDAQTVMHSMTEMGVPATRMDTSSSTDPAIAASEVRVYVR